MGGWLGIGGRDLERGSIQSSHVLDPWRTGKWWHNKTTETGASKCQITAGEAAGCPSLMSTAGRSVSARESVLVPEDSGNWAGRINNQPMHTGNQSILSLADWGQSESTVAKLRGESTAVHFKQGRSRLWSYSGALDRIQLGSVNGIVYQLSLNSRRQIQSSAQLPFGDWWRNQSLVTADPMLSGSRAGAWICGEFDPVCDGKVNGAGDLGQRWSQPCSGFKPGSVGGWNSHAVVPVWPVPAIVKSNPEPADRRADRKPASMLDPLERR
jgi:hypothetical protein